MGGWREEGNGRHSQPCGLGILKNEEKRRMNERNATSTLESNAVYVQIDLYSADIL